jgi:multidrug efflux pump subunit AcrA (membrane-fusion protein)
VEYSDKALAALQQTDQLDHPTSVIRPRMWMVSGAISLAMLGLLVWAIFGEVPQRAAGPGVLTPAGGSQRQEALIAGQVAEVRVERGDTVRAGDPLLTLTDAEGDEEIVRATLAGGVLSVATEPGRVVAPGTPLVVIEPGGAEDVLAAALFFPADHATAVAPGMEVHLAPSSADPTTYGFITGHVSSVGTRPLTVQEIQDIVANDIVADAMAQRGPLIAVRVDLDHDADTASGLQWTRDDGPPAPLEPGTLVEGEVTQRSQSPLNVAFGG